MAAVVGRLSLVRGQHEYRRLLTPPISWRFWISGPEPRRSSRRGIQGGVRKSKECARSLEQSLRAREERLRETDLLRFQIEELAGAQLSVEDEEALQGEQRILSSAEDIRRDLSLAAELLKSDGETTGASDLVGQAATLVGGFATADPEMARMSEALRDAHYSLTESSRDLHRYVDHVTVDPARLNAVDERLRLYTDLARKYGGSTAAAVAYLESAEARLAVLQRGEEDLSRLREDATVSRARALEVASLLTEARQQAVPPLESAVAAQLSGRGMTSALMTVSLETRHGWDGLREAGADSVEFLLAANPGLPARSLARTASGGELSRVLLGLRCALADVGGDETLVFDEIDAGIGGRTSVAVAQKLRELARDSQVVVVTHLAQVAALATR
jgi:DNA repair protein RecN (Recombination protein N)